MTEDSTAQVCKEQFRTERSAQSRSPQSRWTYFASFTRNLFHQTNVCLLATCYYHCNQAYRSYHLLKGGRTRVNLPRVQGLGLGLRAVRTGACNMTQTLHGALPACLPASLPACLPHACLPACLPACFPACPPACLSARLPACLPAALPGCLSACCLVCLPAA
eukprot:358512-Chlamydomonas_euryale.AAC.5